MVGDSRMRATPMEEREREAPVRMPVLKRVAPWRLRMVAICEGLTVMRTDLQVLGGAFALELVAQCEVVDEWCVVCFGCCVREDDVR